MSEHLDQIRFIVEQSTMHTIRKTALLHHAEALAAEHETFRSNWISAEKEREAIAKDRAAIRAELEAERFEVSHLREERDALAAEVEDLTVGMVNRDGSILPLQLYIEALQAERDALTAQLDKANHATADAFAKGENAVMRLMDERDALAARCERWKRMALAHANYEDALIFGLDGEDQERERAELRAAHADLKAHGDLPDGGDR